MRFQQLSSIKSLAVMQTSLNGGPPDQVWNPPELSDYVVNYWLCLLDPHNAWTVDCCSSKIFLNMAFSESCPVRERNKLYKRVFGHRMVSPVFMSRPICCGIAAVAGGLTFCSTRFAPPLFFVWAVRGGDLLWPGQTGSPCVRWKQVYTRSIIKCIKDVIFLFSSHLTPPRIDVQN